MRPAYIRNRSTAASTACSGRHRLIDRRIRSPGPGDALIEALRTATDRYRLASTRSPRRACFGDICAGFAAMSASKQPVLLVLDLILRSL
jgi:hypothetical protein